MDFSELKNILLHDLSRYGHGTAIRGFFKAFFSRPGFKITFFMRLCDYIRSHKEYFLYPVAFVSYILFKHYRIKYGIDLKLGSNIAKGLFINHFNCIVIGRQAQIGENFTILHGATVGGLGRGSRRGHPTIGNNVFVGCGAKILGDIKIGDNVAIGANCVVTKDMPDNAVVAGNPARIVSYDGSKGFINNIYLVPNDEAEQYL